MHVWRARYYDEQFNNFFKSNASKQVSKWAKRSISFSIFSLNRCKQDLKSTHQDMYIRFKPFVRARRRWIEGKWMGQNVFKQIIS